MRTSFYQNIEEIRLQETFLKKAIQKNGAINL